MALNLLDKTTNNNDLTNNGGAVESTSTPFAASTESVDLEASSNQYLSIADAAQTGLDFSTTFTIECWVNFESTPGSGAIMGIVSKGNTDQYNFVLYNDGGTLKIQLQVKTTGASDWKGVRWNWSPSTSTWYHLAVTCNMANAESSAFELFIDAVSQGNGTGFSGGTGTTIANSASDFYIGTHDTSTYFDGKIDDVRMWSDIRTGTEITNNKSVELVGNEANLVAYWDFDTDVPTGGFFHISS